MQEVDVSNRPVASKWLVAGVVMLGTFMSVMVQLPAPHLIEDQHKVQALAAYYHAFPTLFGPRNHLELPGTGAGEVGSLENLGGDSSVFLDFGSVVFHALA